MTLLPGREPVSRQQSQKTAFVLLWVAAILVVVPILYIVGTIILRGLGAVSAEFLTEFPQDGLKAGGIMPAIVGTIYLTIGTGIVAVPIGVAAGVYLSEYAQDNWLTRTIRIAIINLAGVPSVVYGLFGLGLFVLFLNFGTSIVAGSLTLAIMTLPIIISTAEESLMTLPIIISTAEESLRTVPQAFRLVSKSMGATQWQTIWHVVLPQGLPGILTGIILGLERAAGETAPILFTVAAVFLPSLPDSIFSQSMALPYHLFIISTQVPGMPVQLQYGTAFVLLVFVLGMNLLATSVRSYFRRRRQW